MTTVTASNGARPLILLGAGGHAKVVAALARAANRRLVGVCDPSLAATGAPEWRGIPVLGDDSALSRFAPATHELAMGIGMVPGSRLRAERFRALSELGYRFPALIHPGALVDESVIVEDGAQIMAGVVVQPDCRIGRNTIVNTGASIDHDAQIGDHVHIAPGAVLCGCVRVGDETFVGASATLLQLVSVGRNCLIAAGSTLARPLADGTTHLPYRRAAAQPGARSSLPD